jgi:SAM-dependent MidA family methyltransferase
VFLSNELIDAFPVEQIKLQLGSWKQLFIGAEGEQFTEVWQPIDDPELLQFTQSLGTQFEEGYQTEYRPGVSSFSEQVREIIAKGYVITVDYGFPRSHLYDKNRKDGTLQTYKKHTKGASPLQTPGESDITSHIDFTQLAQEFQAKGFQLLDFASQQNYLTHHGAEWLKSLEKDFSNETIPLIKQFQTLTHPEMMGQKFHVLEMATEGLSGIRCLASAAEETLEL